MSKEKGGGGNERVFGLEHDFYSNDGRVAREEMANKSQKGAGLTAPDGRHSLPPPRDYRNAPAAKG